MAETMTAGGSPMEEGVLGLARALVAIPSVNPALAQDGAGEAEIARVASRWLSAWGFSVEELEFEPGRPTVLAKMDRGPGPTLLLAGHLDTIGVADMVIDPFDPVVDGGRLWGRGSADMKGGIAAALAVAREMAGRTFRGTLLVSLTADEEEAGRGCRLLVDRGLQADAAIVCEPTGLAIMPAHKGFAWIQIDFRGQAAHGSRPERGVDAIRHAGLFLARLDELETRLQQRKRHPLLGFGSIHAGTIAGGTAPSVYPSHCRLTLERRTLPGISMPALQSDVEFLVAQLRSDVPSLDADIEVTLYRSGTELPNDHELVVALSEALRERGLEPEIRGMSAWVEASIYNDAGIPALCFGPGTIEDAHTADESVRVDEIESAYRTLMVMATRYLS